MLLDKIHFWCILGLLPPHWISQMASGGVLVSGQVLQGSRGQSPKDGQAELEQPPVAGIGVGWSDKVSPAEHPDPAAPATEMNCSSVVHGRFLLLDRSRQSAFWLCFMVPVAE
jgi:hypothetical protein